MYKYPKIAKNGVRYKFYIELFCTVPKCGVERFNQHTKNKALLLVYLNILNHCKPFIEET